MAGGWQKGLHAVMINYEAANELRKSPEVVAFLQEVAQRIADNAGEGHVVDITQTASRAHARIATDSYAARKSEAVDRNLLRSLDAGRD